MRKYLLFLLFLLFPAHVFASGEFQADYNVQYAIAPTGKTIVTQNITFNYLVTTKLCPLDKIAFIYGGVMPPSTGSHENGLVRGTDGFRRDNQRADKTSASSRRARCLGGAEGGNDSGAGGTLIGRWRGSSARSIRGADSALAR